MQVILKEKLKTTSLNFIQPFSIICRLCTYITYVSTSPLTTKTTNYLAYRETNMLEREKKEKERRVCGGQQ